MGRSTRGLRERGAVGAAGTFLARWLLKRLDGPASPRDRLDVAEVDALRSEVAELGRHMRNLDARLDFTERLLDGALPSAPAPARITESGPAAPEDQPGEPRSENA